MMKGTTIFSDFLSSLDVAHTGEYSDSQFHHMPFKSLFGFSRLLSSYGIESEAWQLDNKEGMLSIQVPFLAQRPGGFVIVNKIDQNTETVGYTFYHRYYEESISDFPDTCTGIVLTAYPDRDSAEPEYLTHRVSEIITTGKNWLLLIAIVVLLGAGVFYSGIYSHLSLLLLSVTDLAGLAVTYMLVQKTLNISNHTADSMCGLMYRHGCDTVLEQKASSFFGIVSWSEVGITYFSVSLILLLLFPGEVPYLALINGCCLPFTIWSIWYQKYRIKVWCTLCVITQSLLWIQFFCFYGGGWWNCMILPLRPELFFMILTYIAVLLGMNRLDSFIKRRDNISN